MLLAALLVAMGSFWAIRSTPIDALPDLSDVQVIVLTEYPGQAPQVVEDQVTYPLTTRLQGVPGARDVRGYSSLGLSFVYVVFDDDVDLYWARTRVLELLATLDDELPAGVRPTLGPDASGVGWAFAYVLRSAELDLHELRSLQDWHLGPALSAVRGVSEVASAGGFVRDYVVEVDPLRLHAFGLRVADVVAAVRKSSGEVGAGTVEVAEAEYMVRVLGWVERVEDLEAIALKPSLQPFRLTPRETSKPMPSPLSRIHLRDVAKVVVAPAPRRGMIDWNGEGEVVAGIVVVRANADTRATIERVRQRLDEIAPTLPGRIEVEIAYDRSGLIDRALGTLRTTLLEQSIVVALACFLFLMHARSAFVAILSIPVSIGMAFLLMRWQGLGANIMTLGGIAISIGVLVDASIVMIENAHQRLAEAPKGADRNRVLREAACEVGPTLFFALLVIAASFLPVFALEGQEGRLVRPLAYTKTWSLLASALVAVTLTPALMAWFIRGRVRSGDDVPLFRWIRRAYEPALRWGLAHRRALGVIAVLALASTAIPLAKRDTEFMPPLWEGDLLYMPTTLPGIAPDRARDLLQQTDRILRAIPEVESVFGKVGRAETATDPAPLAMIETTLRLKDPSQWRPGMTRERLIDELDRAVQFPGLVNAWTMPIRARVDMLSTGIKTPVGIKVGGPDIATVERVAQQVEAIVATLPATASVVADRPGRGRYLVVDVDRERAAQYGFGVADVQEAVALAFGGLEVARTIEGRERYAIKVRYPREMRDDPDDLSDVLLWTPEGNDIPLHAVANVAITLGPDEIKSENAQIQAWVYVDVRGHDVAGYVAEAKRAIAARLTLPPGVALLWSGQYHYIERARDRLVLIVPVVLVVIVLLLTLTTRSFAKTGIVLLSVPFSIIGALWAMQLLGYSWSVASWVGLIALAGLDAEMGAVMLLYLELACNRRRAEGRLTTLSDLGIAVQEGAVSRLRPKVMTVATNWVGLLPIFWVAGAGADVMRPIAAPVLGGLVTSFAGELIVCPVLFYLLKARELRAQR